MIESSFGSKKRSFVVIVSIYMGRRGCKDTTSFSILSSVNASSAVLTELVSHGFHALGVAQDNLYEDVHDCHEVHECVLDFLSVSLCLWGLIRPSNG